MEVNIEQQDEDISFSNTDTNGKFIQILIMMETNKLMQYEVEKWTDPASCLQCVDIPTN